MLANDLHYFWAVGKGETQGRRRRAVCIRPPPHLHVSFSFAVCWTRLTGPVYSGDFTVGVSFALAFWSYIPLYPLPIEIGLLLLKVLIEVRDGHHTPRRSGKLMWECVF